jgi:lysozyme family protein
MPLADAKAIYRASYWNALRCDELPAGLDYAVFDYGVNSGPGRAAKVLLRLLGLAASGPITDAVIACVRKTSPSTLIGELCDERMVFLKSLRTWPVFGAGWGRRVSEVRREALAMAKGQAVIPAASSAANGKGRVPTPTSARAATTAGTIVAGAGTAQITQSMGAPVSIGLTVIAISLALAVAGWIGWTIWHKRKQDAPVSLPSVPAP